MATRPRFSGVHLWLVFAGGTIGTAARLAVLLVEDPSIQWLSIPLINIVGSFLLGVVMEVSGEREIGGVQAKLVIGTGVMGGFTTYSSFNLETLRLAEQGAWGRAGLYLGATVLVCVLAGLGGVALGRSLKA